MGFLEYSNISFRAFETSNKKQEIIQRKTSIVDSVCQQHKISPQSVLFVGFNPALFSCAADNIYVTEVDNNAQIYIQSQNSKVQFITIDSLFNYDKFFDVIVALEEFFTFSDSENDQKVQFEMICRAAKSLVITTLRDYKNQEFKDKEFSIPAVIKNDDQTNVYLEYHDYDSTDRNAWCRVVYEIAGKTLVYNGPFACRNMYFKQCAKFGYDMGAKEFLIHKSIMYKSLIKKNYEHVISILF
jgi:hypothetical protein